MIDNECKKCIEEYEKHRKLSDKLCSEFLRWGFPAGNLEKGKNIEALVTWIHAVKEHPGFLLDLPHAAAQLGITKESFENIRNKEEIKKCLCLWAEDNYYYAILIENFYRSLLKKNKIYDSLISTNQIVAEKLGVEPALCVVCNVPAISTICDYCSQPVEYGHTEPLNSLLRPIMFRLPQVCWKCIFTSPPLTYPLMLGEEKMGEALLQTIEKNWLPEMNQGWLEKISDYQKERC